MKPLCIGQFSDSFPPLMDGVGLTVLNYCTHLIANGYRCHAIVSGSHIEEGYAYDREHQIDYTIRAASHPVFGIKPYGIIHKDRQFLHKVHAIDYSIIHSHSPFYLGPAWRGGAAPPACPVGGDLPHALQRRHPGLDPL